MAYRIEVLRDVCIGAATCVADAPNVFEMDDDDKAIVIDPQGDSDEDVYSAAQNCPVNAIILIDEATGEQVWPEG
ncbi:MAG: ferredoxin [Myxococcales bacterium]|nr:ferredoxin [Myxococcales bacterium]